MKKRPFLKMLLKLLGERQGKQVKTVRFLKILSGIELVEAEFMPLIFLKL